jgi:PAS domain S-box-containing protein
MGVSTSTPPSWRRILTVAAIVPTVLVLLLGGLLGWLALRAWDASRAVDHTLEVLRRSNLAESQLNAMETGQRGYLLTGRPDFRQPFDAGRPVIAERLSHLASLVADNPAQQARVVEMQRLHTAWLAAASEEIRLRERQDPALLPTFTAGRGAGLMADLRAEIETFREEERRLLVEREARLRREATTGALVGGGGIGLTALFLGTIGRRQANTMRRLYAQLTEHSLLLDAAHDAILVRDGASDRITFWNQGATRRYGWTRQEALGAVSHTLLGTRFPVEPAEILATLERTGRWEGDLTQRHRDGEILQMQARWTLHVDPQGVKRILENNHDVTAQWRAQAEIDRLHRQQRSEFELMVRAVTDYAIFMIGPTGEVLTWNDGAARIKGYDADEIVGQSFTRFFTAEDAEADKPMQLLRTALEDGHVEDEGWRVRKDGTRFWADVVITPVRDVEGRLLGFIKVTRDLSERRAAEAQRMQVDALREADVLKDQFIGMLSHELRTPINAITGFGSLLEDEVLGPLTPAQKGYMRRMLATADNLLVLVNDLLDASAMRAGKFKIDAQAVRLPPLAAEVGARLAPLATQRDQVLATALADDLPAVYADPQRVVQVLTNLIGNAIKFTPAGGSITVDAMCDGRTLRIAVTDTGPGIPEAERTLLFRPFTQLDTANHRRAPGTGLGLSISAAIVEAHGGRIGVESTQGAGSTFWFTLPLVQEAAESPLSSLGRTEP